MAITKTLDTSPTRGTDAEGREGAARADLLEVLDAAQTNVNIQASALEQFGDRFMEDAGDLEAVIIEAIVANLRETAREIGAALRRS